MEFTKEEISAIEREMNFITANWHKHLITATINIAKERGVKDLYWNSSESLESGNTQSGKVKFFYERLPAQMGFTEKVVNLRGMDERMWHMSLSNETYAQNGMIPLDKIPKAYQGAAIGILRHRGPYSKDELKKVLNIVKNKRSQKKPQAKGFYYTTDGEWDGAQRYSRHVKEIKVIQRLTSDSLSDIVENGSDATKKFVSFILSFTQHFGQDIIGWVLLSPFSENEWVINQIQTDSLNKYLDAKNKTLAKEKVERKERVMDVQTITDMLQARNKSVWIPKLTDQNFLSAIQNNPNNLDSLPENEVVNTAGGVEIWLENNPNFRIASSKAVVKTSSNVNKKSSFNLKSSQK